MLGSRGDYVLTGCQCYSKISRKFLRRLTWPIESLFCFLVSSSSLASVYAVSVGQFGMDRCLSIRISSRSLVHQSLNWAHKNTHHFSSFCRIAQIPCTGIPCPPLLLIPRLHSCCRHQFCHEISIFSCTSFRYHFSKAFFLARMFRQRRRRMKQRVCVCYTIVGVIINYA